MHKALPLFIAGLLALPLAAQAQSSPPDASEFTEGAPPTLPSGNSITVSNPSPIAGVGDTPVQNAQPAAPVRQGVPFGVSSAPAAPAADLPPDGTQPAGPPAPPMAEEEAPPTNTVVLQGLNKVTGHISKLEGPIGTVLTFDNLEIITRRCWKSPADEQPENAALLEIREIKTNEEPKKLFLGWMFSSSPGLSGLEHPVYDVNIVACEFRENPEGTPEPKAEAPKEKPKAEKPKADKAKPAAKKAKKKESSGAKP